MSSDETRSAEDRKQSWWRRWWQRRRAPQRVRSPWVPLAVLLLTPLVYFANLNLEKRHPADREQADKLKVEICEVRRDLEAGRQHFLEAICVGEPERSLLTDVGCLWPWPRASVLRAAGEGELWRGAKRVYGGALSRADGLKPHLRLLFADAAQVIKAQSLVFLTLILYALVPGFAGLYYRDSFKRWFVAALVLLLACEIVFAFHYGVPAKLKYPHLWFTELEVALLFVFLVLRLRRTSVGRGGDQTAPKYIVVCLDGTWNHPGQKDFGFRAATNVSKLFDSLEGEADDSNHPNATRRKSYLAWDHGKRYEQVGLYYSGVGSAIENTRLGVAFGGAFGLGAEAIMERAYLDVVREYRPGDRLVIVGFSRGAAIARLLASLLERRGVPSSTVTLRLFNRQRLLWKSSKVERDIEIEVLGCWDTVGSFGVPKNILGIPFQRINLLKNLTVSLAVKRAYHMVALDETRDAFVPTLMDPDPVRPKRIVEVWFSGNHANVGGGYKTDRLSDLTLDFLLRRLSSGYVDDPLLLVRKDSWPWGARKLARKLAKPFEEALADLPEDQREMIDFRYREPHLGDVERIEEALEEAPHEVRKLLDDEDDRRHWDRLSRIVDDPLQLLRRNVRWSADVQELVGVLEGPVSSAVEELPLVQRTFVDWRHRQRLTVDRIVEKVKQIVGEARPEIEKKLEAAGWTRPGADQSWGIYVNACNGDTGDPGSKDGADAGEPGCGCLRLNPDSAGRIRQQSGPIYTHAPREVPLGAIVHDSVLARLQHGDAEYVPESLFQLNQIIGKLREHILGQISMLQGTTSLGDLEAQSIRDWLEKKLSIRRWTETDAARDEMHREALGNPWRAPEPPSPGSS